MPYFIDKPQTKRHSEFLGDYLDPALADNGIIGGEVHLILAQDEAQLRIDFWAPSELAKDHETVLVENVHGQMSDGVGECGFEIAIAGGKRVRTIILVFA